MSFNVGDRVKSTDGFDVADRRTFGTIKTVETEGGYTDYWVEFDNDAYSVTQPRWRSARHLRLISEAVPIVDECEAFFV